MVFVTLVREVTWAKAAIFWLRAWSHCIYIALPPAIYRTCCFLRVGTNFSIKANLHSGIDFTINPIICPVMCYCQKAGLCKKPLICLPHLSSWGWAAGKKIQNLPLEIDHWLRHRHPEWPGLSCRPTSIEELPASTTHGISAEKRGFHM